MRGQRHASGLDRRLRDRNRLFVHTVPGRRGCRAEVAWRKDRHASPEKVSYRSVRIVPDSAIAGIPTIQFAGVAT